MARLPDAHDAALKIASKHCHFPIHAQNVIAAYLDAMRSYGYELDGNGAREWERERAARIVEDWEVYSPYVVGKEKIKNRKVEITAAIKGAQI